MMRWLILLMPFIAGCASIEQNAHSWKPRDTALEVVFQVLNAVDAEQTSRIKDHPNLIEGQPITQLFIGENPSDQSVLLYFGAIGAAHFFMNRGMPKKWRPWFHGITIYSTGSAVDKNRDNGL